MENIRLIAESKSMQIIGFTSAVPEQGTSTLTALLSLLMAAREKTAFDETQQPEDLKRDKKEIRQLGLLLIDGQIRHPTLHKKFNLTQRGGLVEILENETTDKAIKSVPHSPLKMVTSGMVNNFNLTQNHLLKLSALLKNMKNKIEFVFMDIPPILAYSEGISLSRLCDGVILVVRARVKPVGRSSRKPGAFWREQMSIFWVEC